MSFSQIAPYKIPLSHILHQALLGIIVLLGKTDILFIE